jgi:hypothetical protein
MREHMRKSQKFTSSNNDHGNKYGFTISIPEEEPSETAQAEVCTP